MAQRAYVIISGSIEDQKFIIEDITSFAGGASLVEILRAAAKTAEGEQKPESKIKKLLKGKK